jgi:hypothetical protein
VQGGLVEEGRVGESVIGREVRRSHSRGTKMGGPVGLSLEAAGQFRQPFPLQRLDGRIVEPLYIRVKHWILPDHSGLTIPGNVETATLSHFLLS